MDLLAFQAGDLYFDEPLPKRVAALIEEASEHARDPAAEAPLIQALALAPDSLEVLVALYRHYFYGHRLERALEIGDRAISACLSKMGLPLDWRTLAADHLTAPAARDMPTVRFLLMALKGTGYIQMRRDALPDALARFAMVQCFDTADRLGTRALSAIAHEAMRPPAPAGE